MFKDILYFICGYRLKHTWYDIKHWFINQFIYRNTIINVRPWDFSYLFEFLLPFLIQLRDTMESGYEAEHSLQPKLKNIQTVIDILKHRQDSDYYDNMAEKVLGITRTNYPFETEKIEGKELWRLIDRRTDEEKKDDREIMLLSNQLEQNEWNEMWDIIKKDSQRWAD